MSASWFKDSWVKKIFWWLYKSYGYIEQPIAWLFLLAGVIAIPLTFLDVLPPKGADWKQDIIACIAWLLVAKEGYNDLTDYLEDEVEG